jgi:hypothetical protein
MTDTQLLTLAIAIVFPLGMLIYSNSRITEAKETLRAEMGTLRTEVRAEIALISDRVNEAKETLRAEIAASRAETLAEIRELRSALKVHEIEHHKS